MILNRYTLKMKRVEKWKAKVAGIFPALVERSTGISYRLLYRIELTPSLYRLPRLNRYQPLHHSIKGKIARVSSGVT